MPKASGKNKGAGGLSPKAQNMVRAISSGTNSISSVVAQSGIWDPNESRAVFAELRAAGLIEDYFKYRSRQVKLTKEGKKIASEL